MNITEVKNNHIFNITPNARKSFKKQVNFYQNDLPLRGLSALATYSKAFLGNPIPIYSIDKEGNTKRFNSIAEAVEEYGTEYSSISNCINGKKRLAGNHVFIRASLVETKNDDDSITVDEEKFAPIIENAKAVLLDKKEYKVQKFYAIKKDSTYKKFNRVAEASKEYGLLHNGILACLSGKNRICGDYAFVLEDEIEIKNEDGTISINEEKIKEIASLVNTALKEVQENHKKQVYSIDAFGNIKKFNSVAQAAKNYRLSRGNVATSINKGQKVLGGCVFIEASAIETNVEKDKPVVDKQKFTEALKNAKDLFLISDKAYSMPLYVIYKNGKFERFDNFNDTLKALDTTKENLLKDMFSEKRFIVNYALLRADEVETQSEDSLISIDKEKIKQLIKSLNSAQDEIPKVDKKSLLAINKNGEVYRFQSIDDAIETLNITKRNVSDCINKRSATCCGFVFIYEYDYLFKDIDGKYHLNYDEIEKAVQRCNLNPEEIKLSNIISAKKGTKTTILAKTQNNSNSGTPTAKTRKKYKSGNGNLGKIYALKPCGDYVEFIGLEDAANTLNATEDEVRAALTGKCSELNGYLLTCDLYN